MKYWVNSFVFICLVFLACNKSEPKNILEIRKNYLVGYGVTSTNWKLRNLTIDAQPQTLSGSQIVYTKQYFSSFDFADTDGAAGSWSIPVPDSLKENFKNFPSGVIVKQSYYINFLSYDSLSLTYLFNGKIINANYKALR